MARFYETNLLTRLFSPKHIKNSSRYLLFSLSCAPANSAPSEIESAAVPVRRAAVPSALDVLIYNHTVPDGKKSPAWSYVTSGLRKFGQQEIIVTILKRAEDTNENYPEEPIKFFASLPGLPKQNQLITNGARTEFSPGETFVAQQYCGLIYAKPQLFPSVPLPRGTVSGIAVTRDELSVYEKYGTTRVLARLAELTSFYPYPTWCDRDRKSVFRQQRWMN